MFQSLWKGSLVAAGLAAGVVALGAAFLASGSGTAQAADPPWPNAVYGVPTDFEAGATNGWYFWRNDDGFHLCSTTPSDAAHPFRAVLKTTGVFADVHKTRLEAADDIDIRDGGHTLILKFHTHDGIDCVTFRTDGNKLNLKLEEFGMNVPVGRIFMGHNNVHPASNPFTITR